LLPVVCVSDADVEALETVEVLVVEVALVTSEATSGVTAKWAGNGTRAPMQSAFGDVLGLYPEQVHILEMKDLNSDSASGIPARRLTGPEEGLFVKLWLQLYPIDDSAAVVDGVADLGTGNFTGSFVSFLREADVTVPAGLSTAAVFAGTPSTTLTTLPVARWVARTDWSTCNEVCGEGEITRTVDCLTGHIHLCNANAPPHFTQDAYMPSSLYCKSYISCPFDWTCPSGPDEVTGGGCEAQAAGVSVAVALSAVICCILSLRYIKNMSRQPDGGRLRVRVRGSGEKTTIDWTRDDVLDEDGTSKTRLKYALGEGMFEFFKEERGEGRAILTPSDGEPIEHVDLNLGGAVEFELEVGIRTLATNALLVGKAYSEDEPTEHVGKAKALLIRQGVSAWQVGEDFIMGRTPVADGLPHDISVLYDAEQDEYVLKVDGEEDARGLRGVPDDLECKLIRGSPSGPRDDMFNESLPLLDELHDCGVEVLPLGERSDEPLFDGDFDHLTWKERQWNKRLRKMEWVPYALHIDTEEAMEKRTTSKAPGLPSSSTELEAAPEPAGNKTAYALGDTVEYWSKTTNNWLRARIMDVKGRAHYSEEDRMDVFTYDVFVLPASQRVPNVVMKDLRLPLKAGERVSVFSRKHGNWYPATIHSAQREVSDPRFGYDVELEPSQLKTEMLEHAKGIKAKNEATEKGLPVEPRARRGSSCQEVGQARDSVTPLSSDAQPSIRPTRIPPPPITLQRQSTSPHNTPPPSPQNSRPTTPTSPHTKNMNIDVQDDDLPVLKNMPAKRIRRRFVSGAPVQVYLGAGDGFRVGTVVEETDGPRPATAAEGPGLDRFARSKSAWRELQRQPGPVAPVDDQDDEGAPRDINISVSPPTSARRSLARPSRIRASPRSSPGSSSRRRRSAIEELEYREAELQERSRARRSPGSSPRSPWSSPERSNKDDADGASTVEVETGGTRPRHTRATVSVDSLEGPDRTYPEYLLRPVMERRKASSTRSAGRTLSSLFGTPGDDADAVVLEDFNGIVIEGSNGPLGPPPSTPTVLLQSARASLSSLFGFSPQTSTFGEGAAPESEPRVSADWAFDDDHGANIEV
jgi:hypothetical protein